MQINNNKKMCQNNNIIHKKLNKKMQIRIENFI